MFALTRTVFKCRKKHSSVTSLHLVSLLFALLISDLEFNRTLMYGPVPQSVFWMYLGSIDLLEYCRNKAGFSLCYCYYHIYCPSDIKGLGPENRVFLISTRLSQFTYVYGHLASGSHTALQTDFVV